MSDDSKNIHKTVGYLEKRGKLKLISSWKKYWFVLEGHLLLYYGSKDEYDALSPCKGSITLGPTCNVKPYSSAPIGFQIETRSTTVTLRADCVNERTKWMQAILSSLNQNQVNESSTKLNHFRYSMERVNMLLNAETKEMPQSPKSPMVNSPLDKLERRESNLLDRLQKLGAKSYSDTPSGVQNQILETIKNTKLKDVEKGSSPKKLQFSPKLKEKREEHEEVLMKDDDFCVCELAKKNKGELNNNWKLQTKTEAVYAEPDFDKNPPAGRKLTRQISLLGEYYSDNELYSDPKIENVCENEIYGDLNKNFADRIEEMQCSMEFIEEPNEFECDNDIYNAPNEFRKIQENEAIECDNEIYASPTNENNDLYETSSPKTKELPIYTQPNQTSQFECDNELYAEVKKETTPKKTSFLYNLYTEPNFNEETESEIYSEPNNEDFSSIEIDENSEHLYSVPLEQVQEKSKKKKRNHSKGKTEDSKKTDGFILRLLRRKHDKSEDLDTEEADVDKTLVMLTNLQDMLEKKKKLIKAMAEQKKGAQKNKALLNGPLEIDKDKSPDLLQDLNDSPSYFLSNLEEEYCEVLDGLQNEHEDIYSEVVESARSSKEITDLFDNLLKHKNFEGSESQD